MKVKKITKVKDSGIRINDKYFVPCYNRQNGYYSNQLEIRYCDENGIITKTDVSDAVEDDIF